MEDVPCVLHTLLRKAFAVSISCVMLLGPLKTKPLYTTLPLIAVLDDLAPGEGRKLLAGVHGNVTLDPRALPGAAPEPGRSGTEHTAPLRAFLENGH